MASLPGMTAFAVVIIFAVCILVLMMTARGGDFSDKSFEVLFVRAARFPPNGPRRGWEVVRIGESEHIGVAMRVHSDEGPLVNSFSAEIGRVDERRSVSLQLGAETVIRGVGAAVRNWLRGVKSRKIVRERQARDVYVTS